MDVGGNTTNGGGFHGYRSLSQTTTSASDAKAPDINVGPDTSAECVIREQDRFMPIANVIRIMRKILPSHAKISDDAKETIQECVSEYISFITSEANDRCQREQRKTITAEDVLWAMSKLGFDDYIEPLTVYLHRYRELDGGERGSIRGDPMVVKRMMVDHGSVGFQGYPPPASAAAAFHHMAHHHHHGFFGGPQMNFFKEPANGGLSHDFFKDPENGGLSHDFFKDPENGGSSEAGVEAFAQCKEQL